MPPAPHSSSGSPMHPALTQSRAPYAEALAHAADRNSLFLSTPGHGGTTEGISAGQAEFFGEHTLSPDIPPLFDGIDLGADTPKDEALQLAAEAWGARRTWFLTNGSSQGNRMAALAVGTLGSGVVTQRSAHSSPGLSAPMASSRSRRSATSAGAGSAGLGPRTAARAGDGAIAWMRASWRPSSRPSAARLASAGATSLTLRASRRSPVRRWRSGGFAASSAT